MLKVIIVDDEPMICSLISQLLDWEALGFEIVGMAYTGVDALDMILKERPDIIITDIRMPGYDGLELIKRTKEAGVEAEFVMISGFRQFEYAQNAMKYGVKYYLLKPIEEEKLEESILEIRDSILQKREKAVYEDKLERTIEENRDRMKKRFLTSMIYADEPAEMKEIADRNAVNREYSTNFIEGVYRAVFVKLDTDDEEETNMYSLIAGIKKEIDLLGESCEEYIMTETHSGIITLFNYKIEQEEEIHQKIRELYENVRKDIERFQGFSVVVGVGERTDDFFRSNDCIKTAINAIKYRILIHDDFICSEDYSFEPYDINKIVTESKKQNYISKVEAGDIRGVEEFLTSVLREIRYGNRNFSPVCHFDVLIMYVNTFTEYCKRHDFYGEEYAERLKRWNLRVDNVRSEKMLLNITMELIRGTMEAIALENKEKDIKPIRMVKKYIEENYMKEITLTQLAELVDMNASYLSSMFKKETGMAYSEYLIHCRLQKARHLLVETNMSISEVARNSGYQEARYFSKQFSKQVGLKPSEYRKLYS